MAGFGKAAAVGLVSVLVLMGLLSAANVLYACPLVGTFTIQAPKAELTDIFMYPEEYEDCLVLTQEIGELNAWKGQTVTWHGKVAEVDIAVVIGFETALIRDLLVRGISVGSPAGVYEDRPEKIRMHPDMRDGKIGLWISNIAMDDLETEVYYVCMGYFRYTGMSVYLD